MRWAMTIDLRKCIGCGACALVCGQANKMPTNLWRKVFDCSVEGSPERLRTCLPVSSMHCSKAPCLEVCPNSATRRRRDGIIDIDYGICIGCGYCIVACPCADRSLVFQNEYDPAPDRFGESSKCDFCLGRVGTGLRKGLKPGVDRNASPACLVSCTAGAISFGDLDDCDTEISQIIRTDKTVSSSGRAGNGPLCVLCRG